MFWININRRVDLFSYVCMSVRSSVCPLICLFQRRSLSFRAMLIEINTIASYCSKLWISLNELYRTDISYELSADLGCLLRYCNQIYYIRRVLVLAVPVKVEYRQYHSILLNYIWLLLEQSEEILFPWNLSRVSCCINILYVYCGRGYGL